MPIELPTVNPTAGLELAPDDPEAMPAGVLIALDRMERGQGERSAVQEVTDRFGMVRCSVGTRDQRVWLLVFVRVEPLPA